MKTAIIIVLGLAILATVIGVSVYRTNQVFALRAMTSIPVLALTDLAEGVDYRLESFQPFILRKDTHLNEAYMVIVRSDKLPVSSYNHLAALVVAKQLVEICPADSTQSASATVTTVISEGEGGMTRILHLRPQYLCTEPEPRSIPAGIY
ncbi:MAG: hypothetical protein WCW66_00135 [Patescibacteria group bacterium]